jgi:hypothetical protein
MRRPRYVTWTRLGLVAAGALLQSVSCSVTGPEAVELRGPTGVFTVPAAVEATTTPAAAQFLIERPAYADQPIRGPRTAW